MYFGATAMRLNRAYSDLFLYGQLQLANVVEEWRCYSCAMLMGLKGP